MLPVLRLEGSWCVSAAVLPNKAASAKAEPHKMIDEEEPDHADL